MSTKAVAKKRPISNSVVFAVIAVSFFILGAALMYWYMLIALNSERSYSDGLLTVIKSLRASR